MTKNIWHDDITLIFFINLNTWKVHLGKNDIYDLWLRRYGEKFWNTQHDIDLWCGLGINNILSDQISLD